MTSRTRTFFVLLICTILAANVKVDAWAAVLSVPTISSLSGGRGFDKGKYGISANNSTIPDPIEVAKLVGVKPCMNAPYWVWKFVWRLHGKFLPILHFRDKAKPKDNSHSLKVLWCKAIASMNKRSIVYDSRWTYDTLPSSSRWFLRIAPNWLFPRLHHANIEARTAYLDKMVREEIDSVVPLDTPIRLISIGSGYDVRCSRLMSEYQNRQLEAFELDLDKVIDSKKLILDRLKRRRPESRHPSLMKVDLNDVDGIVKSTLEKIMKKDDRSNKHTYTIFISEAVMIYLDAGVPTRLMRLFRDSVASEGEITASFCFTDRLENVPGGEIDAAKRELSAAGWNLNDWCPKPGLARHMGKAKMILDN